LLIRAEQVPDDAVVVMRAGVMSRGSVDQAAARTFDIYGVYGISVEAHSISASWKLVDKVSASPDIGKFGCPLSDGFISQDSLCSQPSTDRTSPSCSQTFLNSRSPGSIGASTMRYQIRAGCTAARL
jgi:hypothetical protein